MPPKTDDNIKVAVRVRPFNQRELESNAKLVVDMKGASTTISDPAGRAPAKTFTFDYSYWSFDGFELDETGLSVPTTPQYADQKKVFDDLGVGVVKNAFLGYNAALFAYGQTGSGKSYSMLGYGANKGIVPLTCEAMFKEIAANTDVSRQYQVAFSMLEIYNERVRDLLVPVQQCPPGGLKVRQSPKAGFFVEGLKHVAVSSYADIEHWMTQGTVMRTTASTKMNETSSRSHMVITVNFKQVFYNEAKQSTTKSSDIHLVDLAGSERADATGATGDRLKEGSAINQSLSTLGNVISALAELASGGKANVQIPYRDSVLTKLLHNALGGNSRTLMVAAISPAGINYEETLSTLRYADRAKQIRNNAVVNESPTDKLIRELKEENARLQAMLKRGGATAGGDAQEQLDINMAQLKELEKTWEQRLTEARAQWEAEVSFLGADRKLDARLATNPYMVNINEDAQLSGVIKHVVEEGRTLVGRSSAQGASTGSSHPDIRHHLYLNGLSLQSEHVIISRRGDAVSIQPLANAQVFVNGKRLTGVADLQHEDRIMLAPNHIYVYYAGPGRRFPSQRTIDYDFVQRELAAAQGLTEKMADGATGTAEPPELAKIRDDIVALLPMVNEANAMSDEMGKGVRFELIVRSGTSHDLSDPEKKVMVKVTDSHSSYVWLWSAAKFVNRRYMMQELYEQQCVSGCAPTIDQAKDPFWDPPEDYFLGSVFLYLQSLLYHIDTEETLSITNYQGTEEGLMHVTVSICNPQGQPMGDKVVVSEDPQALLHHRIDLLVRIPYARGLRWVQEDQSRGVICKYKFYTDSKMRSSKAVFHTMNPNFSYAKQFTIKDVSQNFIDYLRASALVIEIWGKQGDGKGPGSKRLSRTRTMSTKSLGNEDEARMDAVVHEADWRSERLSLHAEIDSLRQEVQLLQVEKSSLEKELSVTTLRTNSTLHQQSFVANGLGDSFQQLLSLHAAAHRRIEEINAQKGKLTPELKRELGDLERAYSDQAARIKVELDSFTKGLSAAIALLGKRK